MTIKYHHTNHINGEPGGLIRFAIEGWIEICDRGWSWDDWLPFQPGDSAVYCMDGPNIIGTLVYSYDQTNRKIVVELAYINPEYRHLKLYDELYRFLYENIEPLNYVVVESLVHTTNEKVLNKTKKRGREMPFYVIRTRREIDYL